MKSTVDPGDFGLREHELSEVVGGDPEYNSGIMKRLLAGEMDENDAVLDFVLLNSAALIVLSGKAESYKEGVRMARESIKSGEANRIFEEFIKRT
jgi:anthranilate phosphoribosyltransferase